MTYEFTRNVTVEGKAYAEGDTIGGDEIPPGSLASLTRLKWLIPVKETPLDIQELAKPAPEPEPEPAPKKSRK